MENTHVRIQTKRLPNDDAGNTANNARNKVVHPMLAHLLQLARRRRRLAKHTAAACVGCVVRRQL